MAEAARVADVVCVIAGSSAGTHDFTAGALAELGEVLVHGVAVMPGKPAIIARLDAAAGAHAPTPRARVALGIPGYPVSAAVACRELLEPLLAHLVAATPAARPSVRAIATRALTSRLGNEEHVRVTLAQVGERLILRPLARGAGALTTMVRADGLVRIPPAIGAVDAGEEVEVELLRPLAEVLGTIALAGCADPILAVLEDALRCARPQLKLAVGSLGSVGGLLALARGEAHAGVIRCRELDDLEPGWRAALLRREDASLVAVHLVACERGLMVARGNPLGLRDRGDLERSGVRIAGRADQASARDVLAHLAHGVAIDPGQTALHERDEPTPMAIAAMVGGGLADAGLGGRAAADAHGLDFLAIGYDDYELVLRADFATSAAGEALREAIRSDAFAGAARELPGYDTARSGERARD